jgi:hypothetical protein
MKTRMSFRLTDLDGFFFIIKTASVKRACLTLMIDENKTDTITIPTKRNNAPPNDTTGEAFDVPDPNLRKKLTIGLSDTDDPEIRAIKKE